MVRRHLIDWKFLAMLCVMLLVMVACWGFVARQKQVDGLIDISRRNAQIASDARRDQAASDARAAAQIAALRKQVTHLSRQLSNRAAQLQALLDYLTAHGIAVPNLKTSGVGGHPKAHGRTQGQASPSPHPSGPGGPGSTPAPTAPNADLVCSLLPLTCSS